MQENNQTNSQNPTPDTMSGSTPNEVVATPVAPETSAREVTNTATPIVSDVSSADVSPAVTVESIPTEPVIVTPVVTPEVVPQEAASVVAVAPVPVNVKKQMLVQYGIATLIVLVIGGGLAYALEQQGRINTGVFDKVAAVINPAPAAAVVNGTKITLADYEKNLLQLQNAATQQGADAQSEAVQTEIKKQAIDVLVNTELLRQEARSDGAVVTSEQVEERYQEIVKSLGSVEALTAKMTELGITEASLRKDIEGEILIQGHLSKSVDTSKIAITEADLTSAYEQITATAGAGATIPPLAEIKTQLEAQLKTNKEQELVNAYITKLRDSAEIEVLI